MPRKSLAEEAREFAAGKGLGGTRRLAFEAAYETVIGRINRGRYRGLNDEWERDFLDGVAATVHHRLAGAGSERAAGPHVERDAGQGVQRKAS